MMHLLYLVTYIFFLLLFFLFKFIYVLNGGFTESNVALNSTRRNENMSALYRRVHSEHHQQLYASADSIDNAFNHKQEQEVAGTQSLMYVSQSSTSHNFDFAPDETISCIRVE